MNGETREKSNNKKSNKEHQREVLIIQIMMNKSYKSHSQATSKETKTENSQRKVEMMGKREIKPNGNDQRQYLELQAGR